MGRGPGLGKVLRPCQPRCTDGAGGAEGEGRKGAEANPALSGGGTDGRRGDQCANRRDAARRTAVTTVIEHPADRSGPRTGKAWTLLLPLCRRLQYLCRKPAERTAGDGRDHCVSGAQAETQGECRQERSGTTVAAEVSGLQCHVASEAEAEDRTVQSPTAGGENPSDVAGRSGPKPETSHRPTQPHIARLGCLLPAHRRKRGVGGTRWLDQAQVTSTLMAAMEARLHAGAKSDARGAPS